MWHGYVVGTLCLHSQLMTAWHSMPQRSLLLLWGVIAMHILQTGNYRRTSSALPGKALSLVAESSMHAPTCSPSAILEEV